MDVTRLEQSVYQLATLNQTDSPMISCYLDVSQRAAQFDHFLQQRADILEKSLGGRDLIEFHEAMYSIESYLEQGIDPTTQGLALFARAGHAPFFLPLTFTVPVPNWLIADTLPNIYHLIELKESYHRFIIVLVTPDGRRILEVNMGQVTETVWTQYPELRQRVGPEWSKTYYQNYHSRQVSPDWGEELDTLSQLIQAGGYKHLIIAGEATLTQPLKAQLPPDLQTILINTVLLNGHESLNTIIRTTLDAFIMEIQAQSQNALTQLHQAICQGGLAVAGLAPCLYALQRQQVDLLLLDSAILNARDRELLARSAAQAGCQIETVNDSELLRNYGGVGCLLRMPLPAAYDN